MLKVGVIVFILFKLVFADYSPLMVWQASCSPLPIFKKISKEEFGLCPKNLLESHMVVIFLEENLSIEDFFCKMNDSNDFCLGHLKQTMPRTYFAQVETPYEVITSVATEFTEHHLDEDGNPDKPIECSIGSIRALELPQHSDLSKQLLLKAHDEEMKAWDEKLSSKCKVAFMYTSRRVSPENKDHFGEVHFRHRGKREDPDTENGSRTTKFDSRCGFSCLEIEMYEGSEKPTSRKLTSVKAETEKEGKLTCKIVAGADSMDLVFDVTNDDFTLKEIIYQTNVYYAPSPTCSMTDSYACKEAKLKNKGGKTLVFKEMQLQVFKENETETKFGPTVDCNSLFSAATIMVTIVCGILIGILSLGLCFILDIKTNDRLDDPDGPRVLFKAGDG